MLEARVIEVMKRERFGTGYYYSLKYKLNGRIYECERFYEYNTLMRGDIIYV